MLADTSHYHSCDGCTVDRSFRCNIWSVRLGCRRAHFLSDWSVSGTSIVPGLHGHGVALYAKVLAGKSRFFKR